MPSPFSPTAITDFSKHDNVKCVAWEISVNILALESNLFDLNFEQIGFDPKNLLSNYKSHRKQQMQAGYHPDSRCSQ